MPDIGSQIPSGLGDIFDDLASKAAAMTDKVISAAQQMGVEIAELGQSALSIAEECAFDGTDTEMKRESKGIDKQVEKPEKTEKPQAAKLAKEGEGEEELQKQGRDEAKTAETQILQMAEQQAGEVAQNPESTPDDICGSILSNFAGRASQARKAMEGLVKGIEKQLAELGDKASPELLSAATKIKQANARFEIRLIETDPTANRAPHSKSLEQSGKGISPDLGTMGGIEKFANEQKGKDFPAFSSAIEQKSGGGLPEMLSVVGLILNVVGGMMKAAGGDIGALADAVALAKNCRSFTQNQSVFQNQLRNVKLGSYTQDLFGAKSQPVSAKPATARPAEAA